MISKVVSTLNWLPSYYRGVLKRRLNPVKPKHIYFCICDHFEPYWNGADRKTARRRIQRWLDEYPKIADKYRDSEGLPLKYTFFYPEEEYRKEDMDALAGLCHAGFGEVEIHLHHDNDTPENLRRTLIDYKKRLYEEHGLLSKDRRTGEIVYGFIHGNWALDNSRPDGRWCGVNNELTILQETGCYADFTMPSAPDPTQTRKVNSIYYAVDDPLKPKSHEGGMNARVRCTQEGLLMVQGPLCLDWARRKCGALPRIENGALLSSNPISMNRVRLWIEAGIHVEGAPDEIFVKVHSHGTQEKNLSMLFDNNGLSDIFSGLAHISSELGAKLRHLSAREIAGEIVRVVSGNSNATGTN